MQVNKKERLRKAGKFVILVSILIINLYHENYEEHLINEYDDGVYNNQKYMKSIIFITMLNFRLEIGIKW